MKISFLKKLYKKYIKQFKQKNKFERFICNFIGQYPRDIKLYELAFSHKSLDQTPKKNNERLEFLGDAILQAVVSQYFYDRNIDKNEGVLTNLRSSIVNRHLLNKIGQDFNILEFLKFRRDIEINRSKYLSGNTLEALIGAIFKDVGFQKSEKIIIEKIIKPYETNMDEFMSPICHKSILLEWSQKEKKSVSYKFINSLTNSYENLFQVELYIDNEFIHFGKGKSKKEAERDAAEKYLNKMNF